MDAKQQDGRLDGPDHIPVLLDDVLQLLTPLGQRGPTTILDCTLGLGGHARALLETMGAETTLIGMDADEGNLRLARENLSPFRSQVRLFHGNFAQARDVLDAAELTRVDGLLADLGFCSTQIDDASRGLSFAQDMDGPLDMRFDISAPKTAADIVNHTDETDLANLIFRYGEERFSRRVAHAIVEARRTKRIERTGELAAIVERAIPAVARHKSRIHPATRTFQALRIAVNDEMGSLETLLKGLPDMLTPGGRAAIISFHSREDRPVKHAFAEWDAAGLATRLTKKPIVADEMEIAKNARSRSAKLRAIEF